MKNRIDADLGTLRAIAASVRISENRVRDSALLLVDVDHVSATSVRKRCAAEVKVLADVQTELHRKVREFEQASGMYRAHTKLVPISYRIPNPIDAAKKVAERMAKAVLAEILKTIKKARDKYKKYEYIAKLDKKGVFYGNYAGAFNKQASCEPALEGDDAFAVDKIVLDRYLPGGAKETILWSFIHNPVDPLDRCAAMHDARYGKLGIGGEIAVRCSRSRQGGRNQPPDGEVRCHGGLGPCVRSEAQGSHRSDRQRRGGRNCRVVRVDGQRRLVAGDTGSLDREGHAALLRRSPGNRQHDHRWIRDESDQGRQVDRPDADMSDVTATSSEGFPVPVRIPRAIHDAIAAMGAGPDVDAVWTALQQADDIDAAGPTLSSDSRDLLQWASHRLRHDQRVIIGQSQLLLLVLLQVGDDARTNADHPVTPGAGLREPDDDPRSWRVGDRTTYHDPAGVDVDISPLQSQHL